VERPRDRHPRRKGRSFPAFFRTEFQYRFSNDRFFESTVECSNVDHVFAPAIAAAERFETFSDSIRTGWKPAPRRSARSRG
jgi:hypothetical protein